MWTSGTPLKHDRSLALRLFCVKLRCYIEFLYAWSVTGGYLSLGPRQCPFGKWWGHDMMVHQKRSVSTQFAHQSGSASTQFLHERIGIDRIITSIRIGIARIIASKRIGIARIIASNLKAHQRFRFTSVQTTTAPTHLAALVALLVLLVVLPRQPELTVPPQAVVVKYS